MSKDLPWEPDAFRAGEHQANIGADQITVVTGDTQQPDDTAHSVAELYARLFRTLGDPTRVRILQILLDAESTECTVGELVATIGAPQSRVSTHLGCLRWCGLVQMRRDGKQVYYRVGDTRVRTLLELGDSVLRDHAAGIASCGVIRS